MFSQQRAAARVGDLGPSIGTQRSSTAVDVDAGGLVVANATPASGAESIWAWQLAG